MHIKHNEMDHSFPVYLRNWQEDYIKTGKYVNFTIDNYARVKELWKVDDETGELRFDRLVDDSEGMALLSKDKKKYHLKRLEFKFYDKKLVIKNSSLENEKWYPKMVHDMVRKSGGSKNGTPHKESWFRRNRDGLLVGMVIALFTIIVSVVLAKLGVKLS